MVTLIVLDGFGINKSRFGNAIKASGTPYLKKLEKKYPHSQLLASGNAVGLPAGQEADNVRHYPATDSKKSIACSI